MCDSHVVCGREQGTAAVEVLPLVMAMVIPVSSRSLPKAEFYYEVNYHVNHLLINGQPGLRWWLYNLG